MIIKQEINDLDRFHPWSGAVDTFYTIVNAGKGERFINELESIYPDGMTDGELNDLLWHDSKWCLDLIGLVDESRKDELKKLFFEICEQSESVPENYLGETTDFMKNELDNGDLNDSELKYIDDNWEDWTSEYEQNKK